MGGDIQTSSGYTLTMPPVADFSIINKVFNPVAPVIQSANIAGNILSGISAGLSMGSSIKGLQMQGLANKVQTNVLDRQVALSDPNNASSPYNDPNYKNYLTPVPGMTTPPMPYQNQMAYAKAMQEYQANQANVQKTQSETAKNVAVTGGPFGQSTGSNPAIAPTSAPAPAPPPGVTPQQQAGPVQQQAAPQAAPSPVAQTIQHVVGQVGKVAQNVLSQISGQPAQAPAAPAQQQPPAIITDPAATPAVVLPTASAPLEAARNLPTDQPVPAAAPQPVNRTASIAARGAGAPFSNLNTLDWAKRNLSTDSQSVAWDPNAGIYNIALKGGRNQPLHPGYMVQNPGTWQPQFTNQAMAQDPWGMVGAGAGMVADPRMGSTTGGSSIMRPDPTNPNSNMELAPRARWVADPTPATIAKVNAPNAEQVGAPGPLITPPQPGADPAAHAAYIAAIPVKTPYTRLPANPGAAPASVATPAPIAAAAQEPAASVAVATPPLANAPQGTPLPAVSAQSSSDTAAPAPEAPQHATVGDIALGGTPQSSPWTNFGKAAGAPDQQLAPVNTPATGQNPASKDPEFTAPNGQKYFMDGKRPYIVSGETPYTQERWYQNALTPVAFVKADAESMKAQNKLLGDMGEQHPESLSDAEKEPLLRTAYNNKLWQDRTKPLPDTDAVKLGVTQGLIEQGTKLQAQYAALSPDQKLLAASGWNTFVDQNGGKAQYIAKALTGSVPDWLKNKTQVDPAVRSVFQNYNSMLNQMAQERNGARLTDQEISRLQQEMGEPGQVKFSDTLSSFMQQRKVELPRLVDFALAGQYRVPKDTVNLANELMRGETSANYTGSPPSAPAAPAGTPSRANAVTVTSQAQLDSLPRGAYYRDAQGLKLKP